MPYINLQLIKSDANTNEKKAELISRLTQVLVDVLDKKPESTHVVISEIEANDWGVGGIQVSERNK